MSFHCDLPRFLECLKYLLSESERAILSSQPVGPGELSVPVLCVGPFGHLGCFTHCMRPSSDRQDIGESEGTASTPDSPCTLSSASLHPTDNVEPLVTGK